MMQSRQRTKILSWIQDQLSCTLQTRHSGKMFRRYRSVSLYVLLCVRPKYKVPTCHG